MRTENGLLKDQDNNIVVVRENPNIKTLAMQTGGKYLKYSIATKKKMQKSHFRLKHTFS
jgi:hypothetical protein